MIQEQVNFSRAVTASSFFSRISWCSWMESSFWQGGKNQNKNRNTNKQNPTNQKAASLHCPYQVPGKRQMSLGWVSPAHSLLRCLPGTGSFVTVLPPIYNSAKKKKKQHKLQKCSRGVLPANTSFPRKSDSSKGSWFSPFVSRKKEKKKNQTCRKRHLSILSSFIIC